MIFMQLACKKNANLHFFESSLGKTRASSFCQAGISGSVQWKLSQHNGSVLLTRALANGCASGRRLLSNFANFGGLCHIAILGWFTSC